MMRIQGVPKTRFLKDVSDFLPLKCNHLALALIKTKNRHLFDPLVKNTLFQREIVSSH